MKFSVKFINGEISVKHGILLVDKEASEFFGDDVACQNCGGGLKDEIFYFCKERKKWYCKKCNLTINCPILSAKVPEHPHYCIKRVEISEH